MLTTQCQSIQQHLYKTPQILRGFVIALQLTSFYGSTISTTNLMEDLQI